MNEIHVCSICGEDYTGWGNNAEPVNSGRCCNDCNSIVIHHRIAGLRRARATHKASDAAEHKEES